MDTEEESCAHTSALLLLLLPFPLPLPFPTPQLLKEKYERTEFEGTREHRNKTGTTMLLFYFSIDVELLIEAARTTHSVGGTSQT